MKRTLILVFTLFCTSIAAKEVSGLYTGLVLVADQSEQSRREGVRETFAQVLVKLTGNSTIMMQPGMQQFLVDAEKYIAGIGYQTLSGGPNAASNLGLQVGFSASAVDQLVRSVNLPVLPSQRPELLIWVVQDDGISGRQFVGRHTKPQLSEHLRQLMENRGMPYREPELDFEDQLSLSVNEAWGLQEAAIDAASQRYWVDGWVLLRLFTTATCESRGTWVYHVGDKRGFNDVHADSPQLFVDLSMNPLLDELAAHYTYIPQEDSSDLLLQIDQVRTYAAYQEVLAQLHKLELVAGLNVSAVDGDRLSIRLAIEGDRALFEAAMVRSGRFRKQASENGYLSDNLEFDWISP